MRFPRLKGRTGTAVRVRALDRSRALTFAFLGSIGACGGGSDVHVDPSELSPDITRSIDPTADLLALLPNGARFVFRVEPRRVFGEPALAEILTAVIRPLEIDAFDRRNHVEVRTFEEIVFAIYGEGRFVVLARGDFEPIDVISAVTRRMTAVDVETVHPLMRRRGYLDAARHDVVILAPHVVAIGRGRVGDVMAALLHRARTGVFVSGEVGAFGCADCGRLREAIEAPLSMFIPRDLALPPEYDAGILFAEERVCGVKVEAVGDAGLLGTAVFFGEFPPNAGANFQALVRSIAQHDLGSALGFEEGFASLRVQHEPPQLSAWMEFSSRTVARGLTALFSAEISDLLREVDSVQLGPRESH